MIRNSIRPYEEITILSLANISTETKFLLFCKIKEKGDSSIILSDDNSEFKFTLNKNISSGIDIGDIVLAFGKKDELGFNLEKLIKLNLDWSLLLKTRAVEQM